METIPKSEAERLSNSVMKYIKKARYYKVTVRLPGITDPEVEKETAIEGLKKGFDILNVSKVTGKGSHRRIYVNLRVKN